MSIEMLADEYYKLLDDGCNHNAAIAKVCFKFSLTSYEEALLIDYVTK